MDGELVKTVDYSGIVDAYLSQRDISEKSKKVYRGALGMFFKWCNARGLNHLAKKEILEYKNELKTQGKSAYTISLYITAIRCFFRWAEEEGIHKNIVRTVKGEKISSDFKKEALTRDQARDLITSIKNQRDRVLVLLMLSTGVRAIEVSRADVGDIRNKGDKTVLYIQGKGRAEKDAYVILEYPVLKEINEYLVNRAAKLNEPLFTSESKNSKGERLHPGSISRIVKTALRRIGIDSPFITAHSLRHSTVTFALLGGATIQEAQMLARHKSIDTTMIYSHNLDRLKAEPEQKVMEYMGTIA